MQISFKTGQLEEGNFIVDDRNNTGTTAVTWELNTCVSSPCFVDPSYHPYLVSCIYCYQYYVTKQHLSAAQESVPNSNVVTDIYCFIYSSSVQTQQKWLNVSRYTCSTMIRIDSPTLTTASYS